MKALPAALLFISLFLGLSIQRSEGDARSQMLEIILQHAGGAQRLRLRTQLPANYGKHQQSAPELPPRRLPSGHGAGRELWPNSVLRRPLTLDGTLCYAQALTILPRCYPVTSGRIFLDGCFLRAENYSFFQEFSSRFDKAIRGRSSQFVDSAGRAIVQAISAARSNGAYARTTVGGNETAYVLANCWGSLNTSSRQCCL